MQSCIFFFFYFVLDLIILISFTCCRLVRVNRFVYFCLTEYIYIYIVFQLFPLCFIMLCITYSSITRASFFGHFPLFMTLFPPTYFPSSQSIFLFGNRISDGNPDQKTFQPLSSFQTWHIVFIRADLVFLQQKSISRVKVFVSEGCQNLSLKLPVIKQFILS